MIPLKEFAKRAGVPYTTIMDWAKAGRIKGVEFEETPLGKYWTAPETALNGLQRPKVGRPPKPKTAERGAERVDSQTSRYPGARTTQEPRVGKRKMATEKP